MTARPSPKNKLDLQIAVLVRKMPLAQASLRRIAEHVWQAEKGPAAQISLAVVGEKRMADLAQQYTGRRYRTDVLAFELSEPSETPFVGQVVVNAQRARLIAKRLSLNPQAELALYLIHGLLHLRGYDDHSETDAQKMHQRSKRHLQALNFNTANLSLA